MIHSITFRNFYSFKGRNEINFLAPKSAKGEAYFDSVTKEKLSKLLLVIGANASGKTNFLKAVTFAKWLMIESFFENDSKDKISFQMFKFSDNTEPCELVVVFEGDEQLFKYSFILNEERILKENLEVRSKANVNLINKSIFLRTWNTNSKKYDYIVDDSQQFPSLFLEKIVNSTSSVISAAIKCEIELGLKIKNIWSCSFSNVCESGWTGEYERGEMLQEAVRYYEHFPEMKKKCEKFLSNFDLGLKDFKIEERKENNKKQFRVLTKHIANGKEYELPLLYESAGTQKLFSLIGAILYALSNGGVIVIDELDSSLHPHVLKALIDLFISSDSNPNNAQLVFSLNSPGVVTLLDKYQIYLIEKDQNCQSTSFRLDEVQGVRSGENYLHRYLAGAYGAIPNIKHYEE